MGLLDRFRRKASASPAPYIAATVTTQDQLTTRVQSYNPDAAAMAVRAHGYVAICANRNAMNVANVRMRLYKPASDRAERDVRTRKVDGKRKAWLFGDASNQPSIKALEFAADAKDMEEVTDHPVLDLYRKPNAYQNSVSFNFLKQFQEEIMADSYVNVVGNGRNGPTSLHLLYSQWTRILPDEVEFIRGYLYGREPSRVREFRPDEIWHGKLQESIYDPYYGYAPIKHIMPQADLWAVVNQYWTATFQNQGRPDFLIHYEGTLPEDQRKGLESKLASMFRGVWNTGKSLITSSNAKMTFEPLNFAPKDLGNMEIQRDAAKAILAAFGVPESEVWMNDANLASSNSGHIQYRRETILPRVNRLADYWTSNLLPLFGLDGWWFAPDNPVPKDELSEATRLSTLKSAGILTANECRFDLGYGEIEGGDDLAAPVSLGTPPAPEEDNAHERGQDEQPTNEAEAPPDAPDADKHIVIVRRLPAPAKSCDCCSGEHKPTRKQSEWWAEKEYNPSPYTEDAPPSLADLYERSMHECRDQIVRLMYEKPHGLLTRNILPTAKADSFLETVFQAWGITSEAELYARLALGKTEPLVRAMFNAGSAEAQNQVRTLLPDLVGSPTFALNRDREAAWFDKYKNEYDQRLKKAGQHTAEELRKTLQEGIRNGEAIDALARRVRAVYDAETQSGGTVARWRAETTARTESAAAQNYGTLGGYAASGVAKRKPLLAPNACEYCKTWERQFRDGVPLDQPFYKVGDTIIGTDGGSLLLDFADVWGSDIHPNDRCAVIPVLD